jgi:hypothetical protein
MPYKAGWRISNDKRCLPGTRDDFMDYIVKWVENPGSKRGLFLLGQAGTRYHEVARIIDKKCLGSYFAFLREAAQRRSSPTLTSDLSDRFPALNSLSGGP